MFSGCEAPLCDEHRLPYLEGPCNVGFNIVSGAAGYLNCGLGFNSIEESLFPVWMRGCDSKTDIIKRERNILHQQIKTAAYCFISTT